MTTSASTSTRVGLLSVLALATALRFYAIGHQSFWLDETFTANIVSGSFGHVLSSVPDTESTPHLYYIVAWLWSQLFGHGEAGLRSLSAVFGVATVGVAYLIRREPAALLVAVNPYLVWFSQEARAYSLLVLLCMVTVWALETKRYTVWAVAATAALLTHYFAIFVLIPELFLLRRWKPVVPVAIAGLALLPLALHQRASGSTKFITDTSLLDRLTDIPKKFVTGELGSPTPAVGAVAAILVAFGIIVARDWKLTGIALASVAIPAIFLPDYLLARNVLPAIAILCLPAGVGLARHKIALAIVACLAVFVNIQVTQNTTLQRDDWRGAAKALGPRPRAVVVSPDYDAVPLQYYAGPSDSGPVTEVDVVGNARPPHFTAPPAPPGFRLVAQRKTNSWELFRYRADTPATVPLDTLKLGDNP